MFGWLRSKATCPLEAEKRVWIDRRWAWLTDEFGDVRLRKSPLILPTPKFFPDAYQGSDDDAQQIFSRVCRYMRVDPDSVGLTCFTEKNAIGGERLTVGADGYISGASGYYVDGGDTFRISLNVAVLDNPMNVVGTLAHELGHVLLLGEGRITEDEEDHEPLTDLLTVYLGLGIFLANSVVAEQSWRDGDTSSWRIRRQGYLSMREFGYALALFARAREDHGAAWKKHLRPDVRGAFKQSQRFLASRNGGNA